MKPEFGISLVILRPLAQSVLRLGGDPRAFLSALEVDERASIDTFVPASRVAAALGTLSLARGEESVALSLMQASPTGSLGFFDYLFVTSSTLREALSRAVRFYGLMTQLVSLVVDECDGVATMSHRLEPGAPRLAALTEFAFAVFVSRAREAVGGRLGLQAVRFTHEVADPTPHEAFFRTRVAFGEPLDEIRFDAKVLDYALSTADATTAAFLESYASRLRGQLASVDSFRDRARAAIAKGLRDQKCDIAALAHDLHLSTRTLQRQLEAHGTSHRELLGEVRRELAMQLLARHDTSVVEVAYELGFTEQASFHRAFVRWTGATPGTFRSRRR